MTASFVPWVWLVVVLSMWDPFAHFGLLVIGGVPTGPEIFKLCRQLWWAGVKTGNNLPLTRFELKVMTPRAHHFPLSHRLVGS